MLPTLIEVLSNPLEGTDEALTKLTGMTYQYKIDAASISLLMPIIERGLLDRTTSVKTKASLFVGNLYSLTESIILKPYLTNLLNGLKSCLVDHIPEVRSVSAVALGKLVRGVGEENFVGLIEWLYDNMCKDSTIAERSGINIAENRMCRWFGASVI